MIAAAELTPGGVPLVPRHPATAPSKVSIHVLIVAVVGLPMVTNFFRLSSSVSAGTVMAGMLVIAMHLMHGVRAGAKRKVQSLLMVVILGLTTHLALASSVGTVDLARGLGSIAMLLICLAGSTSAAELLSRAQPSQLRQVLHRCTQVLLLLGLWGGLGLPEPSFGNWNKPIFPFTEPSHLAVVLGPFLIFTCITSRPAVRLGYLTATLLVTALLQSTTLAAIVFLSVLICLRLRYAAITLALIALAAASVDLSYYLSRLDVSEETDNLTTLVYLQGWQLIGESWEASRGLGIGFQQLGVFGTDVPAAKLISARLGDAESFLNLFDGGFTLAKLLSELGILGAIFAATFIVLSLRAAWRLHQHAIRVRASNTFCIFVCAFIVGALPELLMRGLGYFTPTGLLAMAGVWAWRSLPPAVPWDRRKRRPFQRSAP
jgi:hypothetical protein